MKTALRLLLLVLCCAAVTQAQIPRTIGYQGVLTDTLGNPKPDGPYGIIFRFYDTPVGKLPIWEEAKTIQVTHGLFSTRLGDQVPFPPGMRFDIPYYLALVIEGGPELVPRLPLNAVGYSFRAQVADSTERVAPNSITGRDIVDGTVGSGDISDFPRTLVFPAQALNVDPSSNIIQRAAGANLGFGDGLRWVHSFAAAANLPMPRPTDWDGVSDVVVTIWFTTYSAADGTVSFFVRPRTYSPGDTFADVSSVSGTEVTMAGAVQLYRQDISVPAVRFGSKPLWHITIQRNSSTTTYAGDVVVMLVTLSYTAVR